MSRRQEQIDPNTPLSAIAMRSLRSGFSGMSAMVIQVSSLMWMRTIMNYQYRHGGKIKDTIRVLYAEGGIPRFYRGISVALFQGPISRFGDTFSNTLFMTLMNRSESTKNLPVMVKTAGASLTAAAFRIFLTPVDTVKTILQVEGKAGLKLITTKVAKNGPTVLYHGALATSAATFVGHYPWFVTYNFLNARIPVYTDGVKKFARQAGIGFCASVISDSISNSLRVIKTTKQTYQTAVTYPQVVKEILEKDGVMGLLGRGLKIRIITNGTQGLMFSVLWKAFDDYYGREKK